MPKTASVKTTSFRSPKNADALTLASSRPRRSLRLPKETHPASSRPRRSLRLPKETRTAYDTIRRWDAERSKLKHISQVAEHPHMAKRTAAAKNCDTLRPKAGPRVAGDAKAEVPQEARRILERLRSCRTHKIDLGQTDRTSRPAEPQLLVYNLKIVSPSKAFDNPSMNSKIPSIEDVLGSPAKSFTLPNKTSKIRRSNGVQISSKEDVLRKIQRPKTSLVDVLKQSGEILKATRTRRKVKDLKNCRRISIPEVELLMMKQELEEQL